MCASGFTDLELQSCEIDLLGERFLAFPSKALYWPARETVFVADVHLGKAAAFRARSVPLPHGTTDAALARLDRALVETGAKRMVVLGDLWHDPLGRSPDLIGKLGGWTCRHPGVEFVLVTGNHDRKAGKTPLDTGFLEVEELCLGSFCCLHHPTPRAGAYVLCGHIHPGLTLSLAGTGFKLPCFWFGAEVGILPAFGEFTGLANIEPSPEDRLLVVAEDRVVAFRGACV